MFINSVIRAPFYAADDGGAAAALGGGPTTTVVVEAPPGAPGAAVPPAGTLGVPPPADDKSTPSDPPKPEAKPDPKPAPGARTAAEGGGGDPEPLKTVERPWNEVAAEIAGEDKKLYDRLIRMKGGASDVVKAWRAMEVERDSGKWAKKLPTHYTAEELAEFKKANGIPDKPDGYDINLGNGIVWGDNDKPHIDDFTRYALENNMTQEEVKRGLGWWSAYQERLVQIAEEADVNNAALSKIELRAKWGANEPRNLTFLRNQFEGVSKDAWGNLVNARGPDGRRLGDNPEMMVTIFDKLKASDPEAYELPGNGQDVGKSLDEEMAEFRPLMADKGSKYWRGPEAIALQTRYKTLIERREARKAIA